MSTATKVVVSTIAASALLSLLLIAQSIVAA